MRNPIPLIQGDRHYARSMCGIIDTPTIVRSPYRNNEVMFRTRESKYTTPDLGFNLTYNIYDCGGKLTGPIDIIQSNNYPQRYPANTECAWVLEYPEGDQIVVFIYTLLLFWQPNLKIVY